ncbi:MAG: FtsP/CotA-like multicopper oxidase with cupredoxin domain [Glaciecola sp.]|jgi:FtsP/CotA-like multicopper oxidase with cupredoxin domain
MAGLGTNISNSLDLRARMGGSLVAAGQNLSIWYYTDSPSGFGEGFMGDRQLPSAHVEVIEGQTVTVNFRNASFMPHTIHWHGLDVDQANDGVGVTSSVVNPGGTFLYTFVAPHAGTYHYHCHEDTVLHYARGMYGTVIVRPPSGSTSEAWTGGPTFDEEVLWQLSTIDPAWDSFQHSAPNGTARFNPEVCLLNGKETADATTDVYTKVIVNANDKAYIRIANCCYQWARISLGGLPFDVVASDGRPLQNAYSTGVLEMGPGERYDIMIQPTTVGVRTAQIDYLNEYTGAVVGSVQTQIITV